MPRSPFSPSRALAVLAVVLLAAACGGGDAADDAQATDGTAGGGQAAAPSPAPAADRDDDGPVDSAAIHNYELSMDKVRGIQRAAVNLAELQQRRPELARRFESNGNMNWAEIKAHIDSEPEVRRAIESAGINSRDYVLGMMALIQASMAHELAKAGMNAPGVSEHNRRFITEHEAEVREVMESMPRDNSDDDPEP